MNLDTRMGPGDSRPGTWEGVRSIPQKTPMGKFGKKYLGYPFSTTMSAGSEPVEAAAAPVPDWATTKGWDTPQDAVWAAIGDLDSVMRTAEQMADRQPLLEHAAFVPLLPKHFADGDISSCLVCHGGCLPRTSLTLGVPNLPRSGQFPASLPCPVSLLRSSCVLEYVSSPTYSLPQRGLCSNAFRYCPLSVQLGSVWPHRHSAPLCLVLYLLLSVSLSLSLSLSL